MGELLKFTGGPKKPERNERSAFAERAAETLRHLADLMDTDPKSYNWKNINARREVLKGYTDQHLMDEIIDGNPHLWSEKPSWYHGVIAELRERGLLKGQN